MSPRGLQDCALATALAPLSPGDRVGAAAERLRQAIALGLVGAGERLPSEAQLSAQLGVSTMTLRETLALLRRDGLLETRRGRGGGTFIVAAPATGPRASTPTGGGGLTLDDLRELGDEWSAIAGQTAALAAQRASTAELGRLGQLAAEPLGEDLLSRRSADWRLHMLIAALAQSVRLSRAERSIQGELAQLLWRAGDPPARAARVAREHAALADAIRSRDPGAAGAAARAHVRCEICGLIAAHVASAPGAAPRTRRTDAPLRRLEATLAEVLGRVAARLERTRAAVLERHTALAEGERLRRSDLRSLRELLLGHLDELVSGTGVIVSPDVLEVPRWLEWYWSAAPGEAPRLLAVELDPSRPEFYDYEHAEWFQAPRRTGALSVSGAFVDLGGTEQHIVTISLPILSGAAEFLGVAAADVRVAAFEGLLLGDLRALGEAALVDANGRVLLSSAPGLLVGELLHGRPDWSASRELAAVRASGFALATARPGGFDNADAPQRQA